MRVVVCLSLSLLGCGGAPEAMPPAAAPRAKPVAAKPSRPSHALYRDELTAAVDRGLGHFLQRVEVEPVISGGRFQGFRIVDLYPAEFWNGVDLKPGDVVTRVNGMPIERETEAFTAFESLRTAKELRVRYVRQGQPRELVYRILDRNAAPPARKTPGPGSQNRSAGDPARRG